MAGAKKAGKPNPLFSMVEDAYFGNECIGFVSNYLRYIKVWSDPSTYEILSDTLLFAGGSTLFGLVFAASLAWLSERTDMPGRIWIYAGLPMTLGHDFQPACQRSPENA